MKPERNEDRAWQTEYTAPRNRPLDPQIYATEGVAVLLTLRANHGRPFSGNDALNNRVVQLLSDMRGEYGCWIAAYCLMPDHLHFVSGPRTQGQSVLTFVERFKGKSTNESWRLGCSGRLWQKRQHDHVIRASEALDDVHAYILNNPVRAGLVDDPGDWAWSGIIDALP